jgi:alpha-glucosidase (family GH31 glycosyl hydrolase)
LLSGDNLEPWKMTNYTTVAQNAILDRYKYLRHMYTCQAEASTSGRTCFDPLLFHYPDDDEVFSNIEHSFLVGDALKVTPSLSPDARSIKSYFPAGGDWVSMQNYADVVRLKDSSEGEWIGLDPSLPTVNVHLRPGYMVPK